MTNITINTVNPFTFSLVVFTQYRENYGAHSWDGQGECPQHWKNKGGEDVILAQDFTLEEMLSADTSRMVRELSQMKKVEYADEYATNEIIGWEWLSMEATEELLTTNTWEGYRAEYDREEAEYKAALLEKSANDEAWELWYLEEELAS